MDGAPAPGIGHVFGELAIVPEASTDAAEAERAEPMAAAAATSTIVQRAPDLNASNTGAPPPAAGSDAPPGEPLNGGNAAAGSTTITIAPSTRPVSAPTLSQLWDVLTRSGTREAASVQPKLTPPPKYEYSSDDRVTKVTVTVVEQKEMPAWQEADQQCPPIKNEWSRVLGVLETHESKHVEIDKKHYADAHLKLVGKKREAAWEAMDAIVSAADAANQSYDAQSQNGAAEGAKINSAVQCAPEKVKSNATMGDGEGGTSTIGSLVGGLMPKLTVGAVDDPLEREADAAAERVMRGEPVSPRGAAASSVQRCMGPGQCECDSCKKKAEEPEAKADGMVRRHAQADGVSAGAEFSDAALGHVDATVRAGGRPLEDEARADMETHLGHDFSRVRIHDDASAAESAAMVRARAYTLGSDIVFARGEYAPATPAGRRLLAHELTHVVQQGAAVAQPQIQRGILPGAIRSDEGTPEQIANAVKSKDPADVKAINDFKNAQPEQKHQLLEILLSQDWLAYFDRRAVARIFNSFGDLESLDERSVSILKRCVDRSFDVHDLSRFDNFALDLKAELKRVALDNLGENITKIQAEATRLGVAAGQGPATTEQKEAIEEQQRLAQQVGDAKKLMFSARKIVVGQYGPLTQPAENAWKPVMFNPENPPVALGILPVKEANAAKHEMPWEQVYAQYSALGKAVATVLNENPALYALTTLLEDAPAKAAKDGGDAPLNYGGQQRIGGFDILSQEAAREKVKAALTDVYNNARLTMAKTMAGSLNPLQFDSLVGRAKSGDLGGRWNKPYAKFATDRAVQEAEASFDKTMAQIGLALLLASVAIGTAGGATPVLGAILAAANVGTAAAGAAVATLNAQDLDRASQSNVSDKTGLVSPQQAAKAQLDALLYQFSAIVAVAGESAGALLSVGKASVGLTNFQILDAQSKSAALSGALRDMEVGQVALRTGMPPEEMMHVLAARSATDAEAAAGVNKIREFLNQMRGPLIGPTAGSDKTLASLLRQAKMTIAEYWNRIQGLGFRQVDSVSLHSGFGDAELTYIKLIEDTPGREAGIYKNATTGEHAVVQGKGNWSTFGEVSHMEGLPEAAGQRWILVEHYHPERNFAVQFPSGGIGPGGPTGDFAVLLHDYGETNIAGVLQGQKSTNITQRVEATIRYRDPKTGAYHFTTYGYDPGRHAIGSFFVTAGTESGALVDYSFHDIAGLANAASDYQRHMAGIAVGQPVVKALP